MSMASDPPSLAQTYMRGPLVPHGHGKPLSKEELDGLKEELASIKKEFGLVEPERAFMDEKGVQWRFGGPPDYTIANLYYLKGKTKNHPPGSLEMIVENLVKTWEMERSHKLDPNSHRSVDPKRFHISANGGTKFDNDQANKVGNYNVLLDKCPVELYDVDKINWEQSHDKFHSAFAAFPWELLEVFSPPPKVSFSWRHWGHFTGSYEGKEGDGRLIEMYGFGCAEVDSQLRLIDVEIFYKPEPFIEALRGMSKSCKTWHGNDILGEGATSHCPFIEKMKRTGWKAPDCPVRKVKCNKVKL
ncbi:Pathogen-related protein [Durusdinium trenchii]|uniref:Pathogen-related protein n=1 Tax=Durusdinium trenchii TaxID=1381693 RepID=A0ABP0KM33_9DINO